MLKKLQNNVFKFLAAWMLFFIVPSTEGYSQYSACSVNMGSGGVVPGDGQPHCFMFNVSGFQNPLPAYGTAGSCCLEAIGVSINSFCSDDLKISATSPAGTTLILADHKGGITNSAYGSNGIGSCIGGGTSFSSNGSGSLSGFPPFITCAPGQGPYFVPDDMAPNGTNIFTGENINGVWSICITVDNPSLCGGVNNSVSVNTLSIYGNSNSVLPTNVVTIQLANTNICLGDSISMNASAPGAVFYSWSPALGLSSTAGSQVMASPVSNTTYTVTATNGFGTTTTSSVTLNVSIPPVISIISNNASCGNSNGILTANPIGGNGPFSFLWNTIPLQSSQLANSLSPGTYICTVTDFYGCSVTTSSDIVDIPGGVVSVSSFISPNCIGTAGGSATALPIGGTGPYSFIWNTIPAQTTNTATGLQSGVYMVVLYDGNGCSSTASVSVTQPGPLNLQSSSTYTYCNIANGMCNINVSGGTSPYLYQWNTMPVQTLATATGLNAGTYVCSITDAAGCTSTSSGQVNYISPGTINVSSTDVTGCYGQNNGTAVVSVTGGSPPYSCLWNTIPPQNSLSIANLFAGNYTVTVSDATGCSATNMVTISQPMQLLASAQMVNSGCNAANGSATVFASGGTPPYSYVWNTIPPQQINSATGLMPGNYTCNITDANNCSFSINALVGQTNSGNVSISNISHVLCNGSATGSAQVNISGGAPPYTYLWNTMPSQTSALANQLSAGTFQVTVTDANGCTVTATAVISEPAPLVAISNSTNNYCGVITALASVSVTGGTMPYFYQWSTQPVHTTNTATGLTAGSYSCTVTDVNGCSVIKNYVITDLNAGTANIIQTAQINCNGEKNGAAKVIISGGSAPFVYQWSTQPVQTTATAYQLGAGQYIVSVTDANNCTLTAQITILEPPILDAQNTTTKVNCGASDGSANIEVTGGIPPFTYSWNTNPILTTQIVNGLSIGTYTCRVTDSRGCSVVEQITINGSIKPQAAFTFSPKVVSLQNPVCSFTDGSFNATEWFWDFDDHANPTNSTLKNPVHIFKDSGTYCVKLIVKNADGCMDTATACVEVNSAFFVYVPTAFTPNNDGLNDYFFPKLIGIDEQNYLLEIFDKWGMMVFKSSNPLHFWDGKKRNNMTVENGLYIWKLKVRDEWNGLLHQYNGQVTLVR